jgi:hypothetical protein
MSCLSSVEIVRRKGVSVFTGAREMLRVGGQRESLLVAGLMCVLAAGCAPVQPKSRFLVNDSIRFDPLGAQRHELRVEEAESFAQSIPADQATAMVGMMFGAIGGAIGGAVVVGNMKRRGEALTRQFGLVDPTRSVAEAIRMASNGNPNGSASTWMELKTLNWTLAISRLHYASELTVRDAELKKPVASGVCRYVSAETDPQASVDSLLEDEGAGLKQLFDDAAAHCSDYFIHQLRGAPASERVVGVNSRRR